MAADFNKPVTTDSYVDLLGMLRANQEVLARMFASGITAANIPVGAVRFEAGKFQTWNGSVWVDVPVSVDGGGTGAQSALAARVALGMDDAANLTAGVMSADRVPGLDASKIISGTLAQNTTGNAATASLASDSSLFSGEDQSFYRNASNLDSGTVSPSRLPLASGGSSGIVYYNSSNVNLGGDFSTQTLILNRAGNIVTISSPSGALTHAANGNPFSAVGAIPSWARPPGRIRLNYITSSTAICSLDVYSDGRIGFSYVDYNNNPVTLTKTSPYAGSDAGFSVSYNVV